MLEILKITKTFVNRSLDRANQPAAVNNLSLKINEGEFFSLLGPSGCGKTTLLRMIAGLEYPTSGEIRLNRERIDQMPAQQRPFNMVFQRYALFPHLSVFENVAFGLRLKKTNKAELEKAVNESLDLVNMSSFRDRLPETLSGGQSQRVAIARALVNRPKILLLDEPLSALDQKLREHMQTELKQLQRKLGLTFIYVTHDQEEALALSDRIGVMNEGRLEQVSTPENLYHEPDTLFTAQFVGPMTTLHGQFLKREGDLATFRFGDQIMRARPKSTPGLELGSLTQETVALIRPEHLQILENDRADQKEMNLLRGKVQQIIFRGTQTELIVEVAPNIFVRALISSRKIQLSLGAEVCLAFEPNDTFLFPQGSGER